MDKRYIVFEIKTAYEIERFMFEFDPTKTYYSTHNVMSEESQADAFLTSICYCDNYEIISTRDATEEEVARLNFLMEQHRDEKYYGFHEAQAEVMYPDHDSPNEIIMQLAHASHETRDFNELTEEAQAFATCFWSFANSCSSEQVVISCSKKNGIVISFDDRACKELEQLAEIFIQDGYLPCFLTTSGIIVNLGHFSTYGITLNELRNYGNAAFNSGSNVIWEDI